MVGGGTHRSFGNAGTVQQEAKHNQVNGEQDTSFQSRLTRFMSSPRKAIKDRHFFHPTYFPLVYSGTLLSSCR